ncbi:16S rRNA (guanine(527)-N(7))-methyltransferase RsmG [Chromatocurvus halotolerans]|uniref:16S rRNA (guanine(527)-N(7))-methyltransferase RsmG n=1 Tax=Chromatocurvus halotolerans TaxID=1132028 RepID=UPI001F0BD322|nr:16S rRNA (guanine(527)-N(7))-methyltransferase RsmG [Chromatocurvus halotolerans]
MSTPPGALDTLLDYLDLLEKWNRAYNLTAIRERSDMLVRHLLDSLSVLPHLRGSRFLDIGTGAGLPGIPLSILEPQRQFVLLDSNGKKTRFLFQVRLALSLANVEIVDSRIENYRPAQPFDGVLSRAFASLPDMVTLCDHLMLDGAHLYAMRGAAGEDETHGLQQSGMPAHCEPLHVPGLDEPRSLVTIYPPGKRDAGRRGSDHMKTRG